MSAILPASSAGDTPPPQTILLIEDDAPVSRFVSAAFRLEGFKVLTTATGAAGLASARQEGPRLILLDIMLPEMNGLDVLRHLKADAATAAIPVIVLTASAATAVERDALALGATRFLRKPIAAGDLVSAARAVLVASHDQSTTAP